MTYLFTRANQELLEMFAWSNVLLAFDYDGTLARQTARDPRRVTWGPPMTDVRSGSDLMRPELPVGDAIDFLRLIWAVDHALQRRSRSMAAVLGITGLQRLVSRIIGRFPGIHAKQLADILHLHPSSLTALLKRLERRGLVRRRPDGRDRRRWLLGLTRAGQTVNREAPGTIEAAVQRTLYRTAKRDLEGARQVLGTLARELDRASMKRRTRSGGKRT